jgi:hypothetical protein
MALRAHLPSFDCSNNTGQQISIIFFLYLAMNMLLIYSFASVKLEKGHKKLLGSSFYNYTTAMIFYEIVSNIIRNDGLNKKLITIQWKKLFNRLIVFRDNIYNVN